MTMKKSTKDIQEKHIKEIYRPTKQKTIEGNIVDLYNKSYKTNDYISEHEKENDEKFHNIDVSGILILFLVFVLFFGLLAVFIYHDNSEDAHQSMQQKIYQDIANHSTFNLEEELTKAGWKKECAQTEIKQNYYVMTPEQQCMAQVCNSKIVTMKQYNENKEWYDSCQINCSFAKGEPQIRYWNSTFCTKYQLVTAS